MLATHRGLRTWTREVNLYVVLTDFARDKFVQGGLPAEKMVVKPNFLNAAPEPGGGKGDYALFVGRLAPEKGVDTLLSAWERVGYRVPLKVVGVGPMADRVAKATGSVAGVEWLGGQPRDRVLDLMKDARILVFPSAWYEGFPMVIVEALAVGLPVIASDLGGMSSIIDHGRTGLHVRPNDPIDLAEKVRWVVDHPNRLVRMRREARREFETNYTAERNYEMLMRAYEAAAV
jgi:glycosyltransferase involved in cell wall biosynthesis